MQFVRGIFCGLAIGAGLIYLLWRWRWGILGYEHNLSLPLAIAWAAMETCFWLLVSTALLRWLAARHRERALRTIDANDLVTSSSAAASAHIDMIYPIDLAAGLQTDGSQAHVDARVDAMIETINQQRALIKDHVASSRCNAIVRETGGSDQVADRIARHLRREGINVLRFTSRKTWAGIWQEVAEASGAEQLLILDPYGRQETSQETLAALTSMLEYTNTGAAALWPTDLPDEPSAAHGMAKHQTVLQGVPVHRVLSEQPAFVLMDRQVLLTESPAEQNEAQWFQTLKSTVVGYCTQNKRVVALFSAPERARSFGDWLVQPPEVKPGVLAKLLPVLALVTVALMLVLPLVVTAIGVNPGGSFAGDFKIRFSAFALLTAVAAWLMYPKLPMLTWHLTHIASLVYWVPWKANTLSRAMPFLVLLIGIACCGLALLQILFTKSVVFDAAVYCFFLGLIAVASGCVTLINMRPGQIEE